MKHTCQKISALRSILLQLAMFLIAACPVLAQPPISVMEPLAPRMNDAILNQQTYTQDFKVLTGATQSVVTRWEMSSSTPGFSNTNLEITNLSTTVGRVSVRTGFRIQGGTNTYDVTIVARDAADAIIQSKTYTLFAGNAEKSICTAPRQYALVLDLSGSMNAAISPGSTSTRWQELRKAVEAFILTLADVASATGGTYTFKVIFFNGNTTHNRPTSGTFDFSSPWTSNRINNDIFSGVTPSGLTPLGAGIREAVDNYLTPNAENTFIVLFTDGHQNQNPMYDDVSETIPGTPVINFTSTDEKIKIFAIGVGGCDRPLLTKLANPDDWFMFAEAVNHADINMFFTNSIRASQRNCSPRILDYRVNRIQDNVETSEKFIVNRLADKLIIRLVAGRGANIDKASLRLFKDGVLLDIYPKLEGDIILYDLSLPIRTGPNTFQNEAGEYDFRFYGERGGIYEITALVEDKYLSTDLTAANSQIIYAGDPIDVKVAVKVAGANIDTATVRAILLRPGEDLGDLAARANISAGSLSTSVSSDPVEIGQAKIDSLLRTQAFADLVRNDTSGNVLTLNSIGNGEYTGTFTGNEMTGTYRVVALIDGQLTGLGAYQGWETKCVLVDFSRPEEIVLQEKIIDLGIKDGQHSYRVSIMPVNKFGKRIGPGQTRRIGIQVSQGTAQRPQDQLDGTYTSEITVPEGSNPVITITVTDPNKPVLKKNLEAISGGSNAHPFGISLHLGVAVPTGSLSTPFDPGIALEGDLTYRLSSQFALEAVVGYYAFQPDFNIVGGTLGGMYIKSLGGGRSVHLAAGAGAFKPKNEDAAFGYSFRVGLNKQISTHLLASLDFGLTGMPAPDYIFVKGMIGVKYFF